MCDTFEVKCVNLHQKTISGNSVPFIQKLWNECTNEQKQKDENITRSTVAPQKSIDYPTLGWKLRKEMFYTF